MSVMVDTNIWLDIALNRDDFSKNSRGAIGVCLMEDIPIKIAGTSLKDIFYIVQKLTGSEAAYKSIESILEIAEVAAVDDAACRAALNLECPDYEDGIIAAVSTIETVEAIITRDASAFNNLEIAKYRPSEFVTAQGYTEIDF